MGGTELLELEINRAFGFVVGRIMAPQCLHPNPKNLHLCMLYSRGLKVADGIEVTNHVQEIMPDYLGGPV